MNEMEQLWQLAQETPLPLLTSWTLPAPGCSQRSPPIGPPPA